MMMNLATEQLRQGTSGYGWLLAGAGMGGLVSALAFQRRDAGEPIAWSALSGFVIYAAPLLVFLIGPDTLASVGVQVVRGFGYVLVTTTVTVAIQRSVPSTLSDQVFGATHALVLAGTATGSVAAPVLLHLVGLNWTVAVLGIVPLLLALLITPALTRFDRESQALLATLDPQVSILRGLSLFQQANRSTLIELAEGITEMEVAQGEDIIIEGDPSDALYILVSGSVRVTRTRDGEVRVLRDMQAPAYFGEIGIVHGVGRTATVTASTRCCLWQIPATEFVSAASRAGLSGSLSEGIRVRLRTTAVHSIGASET
jgi:CRP-like cAMP-binding protein